MLAAVLNEIYFLSTFFGNIPVTLQLGVTAVAPLIKRLSETCPHVSNDRPLRATLAILFLEFSN